MSYFTEPEKYGVLNLYTYNKSTAICRNSEIQALELPYVWKENNYYTYDNSRTQKNKASIIFLKLNLRTLFTYNNSLLYYFLFFLKI